MFLVQTDDLLSHFKIAKLKFSTVQVAFYDSEEILENLEQLDDTTWTKS